MRGELTRGSIKHTSHFQDDLAAIMEASNEPTGRHSNRFDDVEMQEDPVRNFRKISMRNQEKPKEAYEEEFNRIAMAARNRRQLSIDTNFYN